VLGRLKPDYVLYQKNSNKPLIVIEAKRSAKSIKDGLAQALNYAKRLRAIIAIVSDGVVTRCLHVATEKPLLRNGEEVEELLREQDALRYLHDHTYRSGRQIESQEDLIRIFKKVDAKLRRIGLQQGLPRFMEFAYVLFIKVINELEDEKGVTDLSSHLHWSTLAIKAGDNLLRDYRGLIEEFGKMYPGVFAETKITSPEPLEFMIAELSKISLLDVDADIKGEAFEFFIRRYSRERRSDLGQYFTPRHIVRAMTSLVDPQLGESIFDPFCGTGGMLTECYKHIQRRMDKTENSLRTLRNKTVYGSDIADVATISKMNMIILGDGHANIQKTSAFDRLSSGEKFDIVMTNVPFGLKPEDIANSRLRAESEGANAACVRLCLESVDWSRPNARACLIVPEDILNSREAQSLRKDILNKHYLDKIISLPRPLFRGYTTAKTNILLIRPKLRKGTSSVSFFAIENDGFTQDTRRSRLPGRNDVDRLLEERNDKKLWREFQPADPSYNLQLLEEIKIAGRFPMHRLKDIVELRDRPVRITDDMECRDPTISTEHNRISLRKSSLGSNVRVKNRFRILPGDFAVSTLHTQNCNGAVAISDGEYHATKTFFTFRAREDMVLAEYLFRVLRIVLPTLRKGDLTGRENYKRDEILDLEVPVPDLGEQRRLVQVLTDAQKALAEAEAGVAASLRQFRRSVIEED